MALVKRRVNITLAGSSKNGKRYHKLTMNPLDIRLRSTKDEVVWNCKGASIVLAFKAGSPFNPIPGGADSVDLPSGQCANGTNRSYAYQIILTPTDGSSQVTVDPEVVVDDSTPPPHGKKKKAARAPSKKARKGAARMRKGGRKRK